MMKINPRPVSASDIADQSRDVMGVNRWARSSRTVDFLMMVLGWFTIPVEVFMRRDFGQRWFTMVNFYAGLFLLLLFSGVQYMASWLWELGKEIMQRIATALNPNYVPPDEPELSLADRILDRSMFYIMIAYLVFGIFHLFKIWWRNRNDTALHSFDDGTSRLEPLGEYLSQVANVIAVPFVRLFTAIIPKKQRSAASSVSTGLINDRTSFTNRIVEPLVLFLLFHWTHGIVSLWLFISAISLTIHASWRETAKLNKILDFRDSIIEAKVMMQLKNGALPQDKAPVIIMEQAAKTLKNTPEVAPQLAGQYPDLMSIIGEMNGDKTPPAG